MSDRGFSINIRKIRDSQDLSEHRYDIKKIIKKHKGHSAISMLEEYAAK